MRHELIPIVAMLTGLLMTGAVGYVVVRVLQGPVGQALGRRIHKGQPDIEELASLREHVEQLEQRLLEQEERLDFAERLLAAGAEEPWADQRTPV